MNKIRIFGDDLPETFMVEKILLSLLEHFEAKISSIEESKDITSIKLTDLISGLKTVKMRRVYRKNHTIKGALVTRPRSGVQATQLFNNVQESYSGERQKNIKGSGTSKRKSRFPPCSHFNKTTHKEKFY